MCVSIWTLFFPARWVASMRPRMGGEPPWFLCHFIEGFVLNGSLEEAWVGQCVGVQEKNVSFVYCIGEFFILFPFFEVFCITKMIEVWRKTIYIVILVSIFCIWCIKVMRFKHHSKNCWNVKEIILFSYPIVLNYHRNK